MLEKVEPRLRESKRARVEKREVEVADVPVALLKVKFCRVVEPVRARFVTVTVPVAIRLVSVRLPENRAEPATEKREPGEVVPMPTKPLFATMKLVAVEEPMTKDGPVMPEGLRESNPKGEVVAMPTEPPVVAK